jgi:hypothetical protein
MERPTKIAEGSANWTLPSWLWLLGAAALLVWHGWLTLALFGDEPWRNLVSDEPIVSGVHPQNQYLATLGAHALSTQGRTSVIDLHFQAAYPKTPIFDGARVAEVLLLLGGGTYQPAAYKIGFAGLCMLAPLFLLVACKTLGLGHATSLLATFLGQLVWWGPHGRAAMLAGDCELYLAALSALAHLGFLISYHRTASIRSWFGLWITGCVGWFLQPLFFPITLPVLLVYYLSVGVKHDFLTWHVAFWLAEVLALVINLPWLMDWLDSWWLRTPLPISTDLLAHRTPVTVWNAPLWGGPTSRALAVVLTLAAAVGLVIFNQTRQHATARVLGMSAGGTLALALLGISWEPLAVGTAALLAPALWFACIPAAHASTWVCLRLWRHGAVGRCVLAGLVIALGAGTTLLTPTPQCLFERCVPVEPLEIGLGPQRQAIVQTLMQYTSNDARILWEDRNRPRQGSRWPALLPILTGRSFIGGLDPDGFIEHSSISLINESLDGRHIESWKEEELMEYCRRYNIRWIVAWSPAAIERFEKWKDAQKITQVYDEETGWLFEVNRTANFALEGQAELLEADGQYIVLGNVNPHTGAGAENGQVLLSLHYQAGMRASPNRVRIERATSGHDSIGFVRLRLAAPAARVTLTWDR